MSNERFQASGGITDTFDFEDKEQYGICECYMNSDKTSLLKKQLQMQKEAEEKGETLVFSIRS